MSAHTPEPWRVSEACASVYAGKTLIADMAIPSENRYACQRDQILPNAIRIAACVNYCAGMTAEQLTVDSAAIVLEDRDRLLEALRRIAGYTANPLSDIARTALGDRA